MHRRHDAWNTIGCAILGTLIGSCGGSTPATEHPGESGREVGSGADSTADGTMFSADGSTFSAELGHVCVTEASAEGSVQLMVVPKGCHSSSVRWEVATCTVELGDDGALFVQGTFQYSMRQDRGPSLPDCSGGGYTTCGVDGLPWGTYRIAVGDETLAFTLGVPLNGDPCVGRP